MASSYDSSAPAEDPARSPTTGAKYFVTTHWSVVLTAGRSDTTRAGAALEQLCRGYWHPLYHYIRRRGYAPADAQDLTQEFFARLLARQAVAEANPDRGRFRSFLLGSLKHFLADEWDKARAQKRGGGQVLSLDFQTEETRLEREPVETDTPETAYERRWAVALLEQVYRRLELEFRRVGKEARLFERAASDHQSARRRAGTDAPCPSPRFMVPMRGRRIEETPHSKPFNRTQGNE